jgi:hypothetical protein
MLNPLTWSVIEFADDQPPLLAVVVDTEEEFDWGRPLARENTGVTTVRYQFRAHRVFEKFGIKPTYVVDYPVASQWDGYAPLRELLRDGACEIGSHLHPWVNPPFEESVTPRNSFPGNLPHALERSKLQRLTRVIEDHFGITPTVYKAGRYGVGFATTAILEELGYEIDTSVVPGHDMRPDHGPDFTHCGARPYWFGSGRGLLEVPVSAGYTGLMADLGPAVYPVLGSRPGRGLHLPGIFARLRLLDRVRLTPEGITDGERRRLTQAMLQTGHRVFVLSYHSPSLAPRHTPYVRDENELGRFLDGLERYIEYFMGDLSGRPATLTEVRDLAIRVGKQRQHVALRGWGLGPHFRRPREALQGPWPKADREGGPAAPNGRVSRRKARLSSAIPLR